MRSRILPLLLLPAGLLLALAHPAPAQDWAGRGRVDGLVKNEAGEPIEGAKITLFKGADQEAGPDPLYTDDRGRWSYLGLAGGNWNALIDADGYKGGSATFHINEFDPGPPVKVTLRPSPYAGIDRGDELLEQGQLAAARAEYEKALPELEPGPAARLRSRIGDTYLQEGNHEAARAEYQQALTHILPGEQAHIRLQLGNSYQSQGDYVAARTHYEQALPLLAPEGQAEVLLAIARGHGLEENSDAAIQALERALEAAPEHPQALQLMADLLTRAGRGEEADAYLARIPEDAALPPDMLLNRGIDYYNEGNMEEALKLFDRAVTGNPEMAESYYYRGLVYLGQGKNAEAAADLKKLLELDPDNAHAAEAKEFLSFLEGGS